ncbi:MAG TPA: DUF4190 domain-containing protein [Polyangiaceae bacterium]|nr:DUF4190 domain-containing protein [Polyangiaceae bacterium]
MTPPSVAVRASQGGPWYPGGGAPPPGAPAGGGGPGGYGGGGYGGPGGGGYGGGGYGGGGYGGGPPPKPITGSPETMALHAMTIDPRTGLPRGEKPPASTASVVALVCGILLCLGPLTGLSAIIAGFVGLKAARTRPQEVGGAGLASVGIGLGTLNLLISIIAAVYVALSLVSR